jgi:hypothetical protein
VRGDQGGVEHDPQPWRGPGAATVAADRAGGLGSLGPQLLTSYARAACGRPSIARLILSMARYAVAVEATRPNRAG